MLRCTRNDDRVRGEVGRSMIEMLGVLAIIGVLSVGGIAGYSKAMEQFKINKVRQQLTELFSLSINLKDDFNYEYQKNPQGWLPIVSILEARNDIPEGMQVDSPVSLKDSSGNLVRFYFQHFPHSTTPEYILMYNIYYGSTNIIKSKYCSILIEQAKANSAYLHSVYKRAVKTDSSYTQTNLNFATATPDEISDFCQSCSEKSCMLHIRFKV